MKPLAVLLALYAVAGADDILPQALPKDRYAATVGKSPFVLETKAAEAPAEAKVNPFQNLYLRGLSKADGLDIVFIQRLAEDRPMRFIGNEPGPDELSVQSVRVGNTFRETRVVLKKGTETGEIGFQENTLNAPPPPPPGAGRGPVQPGQFPRPGGPNIPQPIPSMRPPQAAMPTQAVPRPQGAVPPPVNMPQIPSAQKGRVRVIPSN